MARHIHIHVDDAWNESDHPRSQNGQFGAGGGGGASSSSKGTPAAQVTPQGKTDAERRDWAQNRRGEIERLMAAPSLSPEKRAALKTESNGLRAWMHANPHPNQGKPLAGSGSGGPALRGAASAIAEVQRLSKAGKSPDMGIEGKNATIRLHNGSKWETVATIPLDTPADVARVKKWVETGDKARDSSCGCGGHSSQGT